MDEKMEKMQKTMAKQIANGENGIPDEDPMHNTNLPFTDRVMRYPLPNNFKAP
jgi:hypothetical protein